jgi:predicted phage terminase large subunit-like protein
MTDVRMRRLHTGQQFVRAHARRFNTLRCGRRFGKTEFGLDRLAMPPNGIISGRPVAWFAPTYKYLVDVWSQADELFDPAIVSRDKQNHILYMHNGARIDFWTLEDPKAGRSRKYAHAIIDEAALARNLREAWEQSIRPTLTDYRGSADFLGTPKGRDYFAELCDRGTWRKRLPDGREVDCLPSDEGARPVVAKADGSPAFPDFQAFHLPTLANPFIDPEEVAAAEAELPSLVFRQEYLAEFVDFAGTVVKREWIRWGNPLERWREEQLTTCAGGDLAVKFSETSDYTAVVVLSRDPDGYYWVRFAQRARLPFRDQLRMFATVGSIFKVRAIYIEEVAYQAVAVQELLATTTLPVFGFQPDKSKFTRFLAMQSRFQRGLIVYDESVDPAFYGEILAFTGDEKHDAHDDYVDALVMAYHACNAVWVDQAQGGAGDRIAVAGASIDTSKGWGTVRVTPR